MPDVGFLLVSHVAARKLEPNPAIAGFFSRQQRHAQTAGFFISAGTAGNSSDGLGSHERLYARNRRASRHAHFGSGGCAGGRKAYEKVFLDAHLGPHCLVLYSKNTKAFTGDPFVGCSAMSNSRVEDDILLEQGGFVEALGVKTPNVRKGPADRALVAWAASAHVGTDCALRTTSLEVLLDRIDIQCPALADLATEDL